MRLLTAVLMTTFFAVGVLLGTAHGEAAAQAVATATPVTSVSIPWGDWLLAARDTAVVLVMAAVTYAFRALPANVTAMLTSARVIQVIEKGIDYGFNSVAGAAKGKTLNVNVGSEVVAQAVQYVVDQAPGWMVNWVGGEEGIRRMVIARLPVAEDASLQ